MAAYFNDTFTVSSNTLLSAHASDSGGSWQAHPAYDEASILDIYQGVSSSGSNTQGVGLAISPAPASADYSITFDIVVNSTSLNANAQGVLLRYSDTADTGYLLRGLPNGGVFQLWRVVGGVQSLIDTVTFSFAVQTYTCIAGISTNGSGNVEITLSVDGAAQTWDTAASTIYTDSSADKVTVAGYPGIRTGNQTNYVDNFSVDAGALGDTVAITERGTGEVIQRNTSTASQTVTVSGTYSGTPTAIECRIVDAADDTTEIVTWATLDAAPAGGSFSGTMTVPEGGWYHAEVRWSNDNLVTDLQSQDWAVGAQILCWGQSNMYHWFTIGTGTANGSVSQFSTAGGWSKMTTTGAGAIAFGNTLSASLGVPVGLVNSAVSATQLTGGVEWGDDTSGSVYDNAITDASNAGNSTEAILWMQGERDSVVSATGAAYQTALEDLINTRSRGIIGNASTLANLPWFIGQLGRRTDGSVTDAVLQRIKTALRTVADGAIADVYLAAEMYDLPMADFVHLAAAGYATHGQRFAQAVIDILGSGTYHRGPQIATASLVDSTTVDVHLTHDGGTDFTPTSAITGIEVLDDGALATVTAAVRQDADTVRLTVGAALTGTVTVRSAYGANPVITGVLKDSSGLTLPLESVETVSVSAIESSLVMTITGIPNGTYEVTLVNPATDIVVFVGDVAFSSGSGTASAVPVAASTVLKGFADDGLTPPTDGAVIYGTTA